MGQKPTKPTKPWADQPFKLLESPAHKQNTRFPQWGASQFANEMTVVHVHIIRILNAIYQQAPHVKEPKDIQDFTTFMYAWGLLVHEHHGNEEELFFPWLEEYLGIPGYMQVNIDQHHAFEPGMKELDAYVKGLREGTETYDGMKVRRIIDGFGHTLTQHLSDEIEFLLQLEKFGDKVDWKTLNKKITDYAVAHADVEYVIPIMLTNGDNTWEKGVHDHYWPPLPWYAMLIFKWLHVPKQKGAWRFSCSDTNGNPRDLAFVEEKQ